MKKIIIILTLFSIAIGQDKMILKSGKEIVLSGNNNLKTMNRFGFLENNSRRYSKESIALITLNFL